MSKGKTILLTLFVMLLWGSLYGIVKMGFTAYHVEDTADIFVFAGIRFAISGGIICLYCALRDKASYATTKGTIPPILLIGFFSVILHYSLSYGGLLFTDSSKTALIKQVGVLFYICFSFLFIREDRPTVRKILASLMGFAGIVLLNFNGDEFKPHWADILILGASFCTVFTNVISKKVFRKTSPVVCTGISQFFGGAVLLVLGLCMGGSMTYAFDRNFWIMPYICIATVVGYCIWYSILKHGELSKLFILKFAEPIFACIFGAIFMGEWEHQYLWAFLLTSTGIVISNLKKHKAPAPEEAEAKE